MDTRLMLQITLGVLGTLIVVVGGLITYEMTRDADTQVVEHVVEKDHKKVVKQNPWASQANRKAAIKLVERSVVAGQGDDDAEPVRVSELVGDKKFVADKLGLQGAEPVGWKATWWGKTKYGPQFYLVQYVFEDVQIPVGPAWLVDLKDQKVVPKNVLAEVTSNPQKGVESDYYDKRQQVVSAITNHQFESGVNLGGALLLYFADRAKHSDDNTILGWTIQHDRGNKFDAYFQWIEHGTPTYAEYKFDYDRKALRSVNLQAADIMRAGADFEHTESVDILPRSYDADKGAWLGPAKKACASPNHRSRCKALASLLDEHELVKSLEWLLTARANTPEDFETCKKKHNCRFMPQPKGKDTYRILYVFNLAKDDAFNPKDPQREWACQYSLKKPDAAKAAKAWGTKGRCLAWDVNAKTGDIEPVDHTSTSAYRAIHPRS